MMEEIEKGAELMVLLELLPGQEILVVAGKRRLAAMEPEKGDFHAGCRLPPAIQDFVGRESQIGTDAKTDLWLVGVRLQFRIRSLGVP